MRPLVRWQYALYQPHAHQRAHLAQPLQGRLAWIGNFAFVGGGGQIAVSEAAIVMRWAHQPVEIDFDGRHGRNPVIASSSFTAPAATRLAIGHAE